jgi:hypothetical protein
MLDRTMAVQKDNGVIVRRDHGPASAIDLKHIPRHRILARVTLCVVSGHFVSPKSGGSLKRRLMARRAEPSFLYV